MCDNIFIVYPSLVEAEIIRCEVGILSFIEFNLFLRRAHNTQKRRPTRDAFLMRLLIPKTMAVELDAMVLRECLPNGGDHGLI